MKKSLILLLFALSFQIICNSQVVNSYDRLIQTKQRNVIGNSKQFRSLDLGISFQKTIQSNDTVFYIKFLFRTSEIEENNEIFIAKNDIITFKSKTGKSIDLTVHKDIRMDVLHTEEPFETPKYYYSTTFYLKIKKQQLKELGSEKFYTLTITYNDLKTKEARVATFYSPKLFTSRSFLKKDIRRLIYTPINSFNYSE